MEPFANGAEHLFAELQRLDLMLERQVLRLQVANLITQDDLRGLYIPDAQVDALLRQKRGQTSDAASRRAETESTAALTLRIEQSRAEIDVRVQVSLRAGIDLPLARLAQLFGLSAFEVDVLLVAIAPEIDLRYETLYAYAQNDVTKKRPSVDLALKLLCLTPEDQLAGRTAFAADGALLRQPLLKLFDDPQDREPPLLARFMKAEQRVVDFLLGHDEIDHRLLPFTRRLDSPPRLSDLALPQELIAQLTRASQVLARRDVIFLFQGPDGLGKQTAAAALCAELGMPLLVADMRRAAQSEHSVTMLAGLLRREAMLRRTGLYVSHLDAMSNDEPQTYSRMAEWAGELAKFDHPRFVSTETPWTPNSAFREVSFIRFEFPLPDFPLRLRLWQQALGNDAKPDLDAVADKFVLAPQQIRAAARDARNLAQVRGANGHGPATQDLHAAARAQSDQGLRRLAQKIEPFYDWEDIVLPPRALQQLREVCTSLQYRQTVYSHWGFERKLSLGKGLKVLFAGPSGTGKTMAAGIIAHELRLDLYKIDLSSVVSKYIGETEKNLAIIFRQAQASNAMIFFDEADALFGKRSEVKDAHDRYANIEVAYLLQKMDDYDGIVILATNLSKNLDEAFARRMHHTVDFPFPDASLRERIWRGMFPPEAPLHDDVDFGFLARQFDLAGGNIRNIAIAAAFMAAEDGHAIRMEHLIRAMARELYKIGKLPSRADFRDYYELIREAS